jgi:hypothetical protein
MKKRIYSLMFVLGFTTLTFAQYNLFDAADCDADGWLWFDSQAKIDKYIGQADNDYGKSNPDGKVIQMVCADFGDYEDSTVDPNFVGAGTDGVINGAGAKKGAIILAQNSKFMATNGGGILVCAPSLSTISLSMSSENKVGIQVFGTTIENNYLTEYKVISSKYALSWPPLFRAGQYTWTGIEKLDSNNPPYFNLQSDVPIIAYIKSTTNAPIYIHGIKVTTPTPSGIQNTFAKENIAFDGKILTANQTSAMAIYNLAGQRVLAKTAQQLDCSKLARGVYIAKVKNGTQQVAQKIVID